MKNYRFFYIFINIIIIYNFYNFKTIEKNIDITSDTHSDTDLPMYRRDTKNANNTD